MDFSHSFFLAHSIKNLMHFLVLSLKLSAKKHKKHAFFDDATITPELQSFKLMSVVFVLSYTFFDFSFVILCLKKPKRIF